MQEGILIGRKDGIGKPISDVLPMDEARKELAEHRLDSKKFKGYDILELWKPVGVLSAVKAVIVAREKRNGDLAEAEAVKPKGKGKATAVAAALFLALAFQAHAQKDITTELGATSLTASVTNTTSSAAFQWRDGDVLVLQATCTAANAGTSNVVFKIDTSVNGSQWQASAYSATFACNGSNVANTVVQRITNNAPGGLYWKVGGVENYQTNTVTLSGVTYYRKEQ